MEITSLEHGGAFLMDAFAVHPELGRPRCVHILDTDDVGWDRFGEDPQHGRSSVNGGWSRLEGLSLRTRSGSNMGAGVWPPLMQSNVREEVIGPWSIKMEMIPVGRSPTDSHSGR